MGSSHAGPAQLNLRPGVGELCAQGKGIDGSGHTIDGIGSDIANAVVLRHGTGNGTGDELGLKHPAIVGAEAAVGLVKGAAEEINLGIFDCGLQNGLCHLGHGGKHHLSAVLDCLFNQLFGLLRGVALEIVADSHFFFQGFLHIFSALVVPQPPAAGGGGEGVDECHIQVVRQGNPAQEAGLGGFQLGGHIHRIVIGGHDVRP